MKKLYYDINKSITIPESVEEMTGRHLIALATILSQKKNKLAASVAALKALAGIGRLKYFFLDPEVKFFCLEHIQYIFEDLKITAQLIPRYKGFHGPKGQLENFTLSEFFFSEIYYADFVNAKPGDFSSLHKLVAVLYRHAKKKYNTKLDKDGDIRIEFNANTVNYFAAKVARWPIGIKHAILMFYDGCRQKIKNNNPNIFGEGGSDNGTGMYGLMRGLAGAKFGEMEKVEKMYLHTALLEINLLIEEEQRIESASK